MRDNITLIEFPRAAPPRRSARTALLILGAALLLVGCGEAREEEIVRRGDQAFARGDLDEAQAEYRLALRRGHESAGIWARLGHTSAEQGRITEARDNYLRAAELDPAMGELGAADLIGVARRAAERQDRVTAATAVVAAEELSPGITIEGLALPLARYFDQEGDHEQALLMYQRAVREGGETPSVVFEMAVALAEMDDCQGALPHFARVRSRLNATQRTEADWRGGNCALELATSAMAAGDAEGALRYYRETISLGEPSARIGEVWMEIAEIHAARGECASAIEALDQALARDLTGAMRSRARERIDDITFRGGCR